MTFSKNNIFKLPIKLCAIGLMMFMTACSSTPVLESQQPNPTDTAITVPSDTELNSPIPTDNAQSNSVITDESLVSFSQDDLTLMYPKDWAVTDILLTVKDTTTLSTHNIALETNGSLMKIRVYTLKDTYEGVLESRTTALRDFFDRSSSKSEYENVTINGQPFYKAISPVDSDEFMTTLTTLYSGIEYNFQWNSNRTNEAEMKIYDEIINSIKFSN